MSDDELWRAALRHHNACDYHEAHELFEDLWLELGNRADKDIVQALAQADALAVHLETGNLRAAQRLMRQLPQLAAAAVRRRASQSCTLTLIINADGVTTRVRMVAKPSPNTIAVDNCDHHCMAGAPMEISRMIKSMLTPSTIGNRPRIVVTEVSNTGLNHTFVASYALDNN